MRNVRSMQSAKIDDHSDTFTSVLYYILTHPPGSFDSEEFAVMSAGWCDCWERSECAVVPKYGSSVCLWRLCDACRGSCVDYVCGNFCGKLNLCQLRFVPRICQEWGPIYDVLWLVEITSVLRVGKRTAALMVAQLVIIFWQLLWSQAKVLSVER